MDDRMKAISNDLTIQWQDHFNMREQTWKVLQYSIMLFIGVVGLQLKVTDTLILRLAYMAVTFTSAFGLIIAFHHRGRQKEKFDIIGIYEHELGLDQLKAPVLNKSRETWAGKLNTSTYIAIMQLVLCVISIAMLLKL